MRIKIQAKLSKVDVLRTRLAASLISAEALCNRVDETKQLIRLIEPVTRAILNASYSYGYFVLPRSMTAAYSSCIPELGGEVEYEEGQDKKIVDELKQLDSANSALYDKCFDELQKMIESL